MAKFRKDFSINLIMDLHRETEISELGLARWCHKQLSESKKILLVISKEYLKVFYSCNDEVVFEILVY